jgi:hypothetical protein
MKAIPVIYDRIEYRSRLEAKWASFFDQLGWQHIYEPFTADYYVPDFVIHGEGPLLAEIRPVVTVEDYELVATEVDDRLGDDDGAWRNGVVAFGVSPLPYAGHYLADRVASPWGEAAWYRCPECRAFAIESRAKATVAPHGTQRGTLEKPITGAQMRKMHALFNDAGLQDRTMRLAVINAILNTHDPKPRQDRYHYTPCGHLISGDHIEEADPEVIHQLWATACNNVKWHGKTP